MEAQLLASARLPKTPNPPKSAFDAGIRTETSGIFVAPSDPAKGGCMASEQKGRGGRQSSSSAQTPMKRSTAADRRSSWLTGRDLSRDTWLDPIQRFFGTFGLGAAGNRIGDWNFWNPQIETFQRGDQLVVRADLPGMSKDDVNVEITDDAIILSGERRDEFEDEREGLYRSERTYGSFYR